MGKTKKILVTGAKGFIGKNFIAELRNCGYKNIYEYGRTDNELLLDAYTKDCDIVYHLAGVNRPKAEEEFMEGNYDFTKKVIEKLKEHNNYVPIVLSSSIHAKRDHPYGISKRASEEVVFSYGNETNTEVYVYRLPNVFGKWSRPDYNSVIATFCYRIARDKTIKINDSKIELELTYIDDVVNEFVNILKGRINKKESYYSVKPTYHKKLVDVADLLQSFRNSRKELSIPDMSDDFTKKLYSTYISFLPKNDFVYNLKMNIDERGSFTEFIRMKNSGQISVNISKPGITKGNHWHHTKNEKFLVVSGKGIIRLREINSEEIIEHHVCGNKLQVVDIPVGYTHNIENLGETDLVTVMWVNEPFDPNAPDTYFLEVE